MLLQGYYDILVLVFLNKLIQDRKALFCNIPHIQWNSDCMLYNSNVVFVNVFAVAKLELLGMFYSEYKQLAWHLEISNVIVT